MKFLLNMNVAPALGPMLAAMGHEWRHVADIGMATAKDVAIVAEAKEHGECVLTHDLDYGQILAFSGDSSPSVVVFRSRRTSARTIHRRISDCWTEIGEALASGAVVTIEDAAVRIRLLPIGSGG